MLKKLLRLLPGKTEDRADAPETEPSAPDMLEAAGAHTFDLAGSMVVVNGLPVPDWSRVQAWIDSIADPASSADAWARAELAWLAHLRRALGSPHRLASIEGAALLSTLEPKVATATLDFMAKTLTRILRVLDGVAESPPLGRDILIVFDDHEIYYRYVSRHYPDSGEFAFSGGMHINDGCSHFVTTKADLQAIEPVIVHEMTHACLGHLPIPAWLNEGLAVNTEHRLSPTPASLHTPQQLHAMHRHYWTEARIQTFWSGESFLATDEGNLLSYDLARILVEHLSRDWSAFGTFARQATLDDAGRDAASSVLGVDLGKAVAAMFDVDAPTGWAPDPARWHQPPERGGFAPNGPLPQGFSGRARPSTPAGASNPQPR